jgi:hypothetical protein
MIRYEAAALQIHSCGERKGHTGVSPNPDSHPPGFSSQGPLASSAEVQNENVTSSHAQSSTASKPMGQSSMS